MSHTRTPHDWHVALTALRDVAASRTHADARGIAERVLATLGDDVATKQEAA